MGIFHSLNKTFSVSINKLEHWVWLEIPFRLDDGPLLDLPASPTQWILSENGGTFPCGCHLDLILLVGQDWRAFLWLGGGEYYDLSSCEQKKHLGKLSVQYY